MTIAAKVREFMEQNDVDYEVIPHAVTYTAQETAASVHRPGREVVKPVLLTDGEEYALAVVDAPHQVDLDSFARASGMEGAVLADEAAMRELFPDCEPGAMPPFGNLYGIKVFCDKHLEKDDTITFNACTHHEAVRMKWEDFKRLVKPVMVEIFA
ncbi:MAG: YbaK/EbsC family protein [Candidatus Glassbacteria bacterium]|nr:YbaK/EbsC family protein [Candidatus Glassbacteria bacterium]